MSKNVYKDPYKERTIEELTLPKAAQRKSRTNGKTYGLKDGDLTQINDGGGAKIEVDSELSVVSENPVQNKVVTGALGGKQPLLISGGNIKTINGNSLLGSGNIVIEGGGGTGPALTIDSELSDTSENPVQNKVINKALFEKQEVLVNEFNVKSINGQSLLGSGTITIKEGGTVDAELSKGSVNPVQNKVVTAALESKASSADLESLNTRVDFLSTKNKGLFATETKLKIAYPDPSVGDWAIVGDSVPGQIYRCETPGVWRGTGEMGGGDAVDLTSYLQFKNLGEI